MSLNWTCIVAGGISDACKTSAEYWWSPLAEDAAADLHMPQELEPTAFVKREKSSMPCQR
jgi:hypothetical protein